jgi:hypothetical protein
MLRERDSRHAPLVEAGRATRYGPCDLGCHPLSERNLTDGGKMRRVGLSLIFLGLAACGGTESRTGPHNASASASGADASADLTDPVAEPVRTVVRLDMVPGSSTNTIGFGLKQPEVIFAVLSSPDFDATQIDPATVSLGDEAGSDTPLAKNKNGSWKFVRTYANRDFLLDFYGYVNKSAMERNGDLTLGTTSLTVLAALKAPNGAGLVRGTDMVKVVP